MQALILVLNVYTVNTRFSDTLGEKDDKKKKRISLILQLKQYPSLTFNKIK